MLDQRSRSLITTAATLASPENAANFAAILTSARRQMTLLIVCAIVGLCLGVAYASSLTPQFTASTDLLIDNRQLRAVQDVSSVATVTTVDDAAVESQVEILRSEKLAMEVVKTLKLKDDPEFNTPKVSAFGAFTSSLRAFIRQLFSSGPSNGPVSGDDPVERTVIAALLSHARVDRLPKTYVLTISFTWPDPVRAAQVANAFAEAYLTDQLNSRYEATRRASVWLQERISDLRQQASTADLEVQKYRAENNLLSADGKLVSEQQLTEITTQLTEARADMANAQAKYTEIRNIIDTHQVNAAVTDSLSSTVINQLRTQYLDASKRQAEITAKLGPNHLQAINLRAQMAEYERLMFDELGRIAATYQSSLNVASARERSLAQSLSTLSGTANTTNENLVKLRQLQQNADTYTALYQTFLQRYQESVQQQSFPMNDARVITNASVPTFPSEPKKVLIAFLSLVIGCVTGAGVGALREFRERGFRTGDQVRDTLGSVRFLGVLPIIASRIAAASRLRRAVARPKGDVGVVASQYRHVLDQPMSAFSETMRSIKVAVDSDLRTVPTKVIGFVSLLPGEGKTTTSKNFASLLASQGSSVLLVDGDVRNAGLTRALMPGAEAGILEMALDDRHLSEVAVREADSGLIFVPAVRKQRFVYAGAALASMTFRDLRDANDHPFDYIIVDLPPLGAVVDARAAAKNMDGFVLVIEWGTTARRGVESILATHVDIAERLVGVVLNKVDMRAVKRYERFGSTEYYSKQYARYYGTNR